MFEKMKIRYLLVLHILALIAVVALIVTVSSDVVFMEMAIQIAFYIVVPLLFFGYYFRKQGVSVTSVAFVQGVRRWLPLLCGVVALSILFSVGIFWLQIVALTPISPALVEFLLEPAPIPDGIFYLVFTVLSIAVIGPIAEEFIFRGVLLKRLMAKTSLWGGVLISSGLFAVLHVDVIGAFLFGIIASLLYLRTQNLLVPILLHILNNSIAVWFAFAVPVWPDWANVTGADALSSQLMGLSVILTLSGGLLIWIIFRLAKGLEESVQKENQPSMHSEG